MLSTSTGIHSDERLVPKWQTRRVGDFVPSAGPQILGGRLADIAGWKVTTVEPGHVLVLQGWGAFVLEPMEGGWTRLIIRTHFARPGNLIATLASAYLFDSDQCRSLRGWRTGCDCGALPRPGPAAA